MNTTCSPRTCAPATSGVTESLRKPLYNVTGNAEGYEAVSYTHLTLPTSDLV